MPYYYANFPNRPVRLELNVWEASWDANANTSRVNWELRLIKDGNTTPWTSEGQPWAVEIEGQYWGSNYAFDLRNVPVGGNVFVGSGWRDVAHNADGTKSVFVAAQFDDQTGLLGFTRATGNLGLTNIPRASKPTLSSGTVDAGSPVTINTNRASSSFNHKIWVTFGSTNTLVYEGSAASYIYTPPLSLLSQIPNSASGVATVTVETFNGPTTGPMLGKNAVSLTITAPASAVPTFTTVTHSDANTFVASNIGAYVQNQSKLNLAITGAAGIYGSTITSYKITAAGQTINAASGTTTPITLSGSVNLVGTITDSRGRTATKSVTVNVLAYTMPALTGVSVQRANSDGTVNTDGTYIKIGMTAAVQSLVNGTQKNALTYKISTRQRGATTWTLNKTVPVGALTFSGTDLVGTFAIENAWEVLIEASDKLNTTSVRATVATSAIFMHWGTGLGVGKFWEQGAVDVAGRIWQNSGKFVWDSGDVALSTQVYETANNSRLITPFTLNYWGANRERARVQKTTGTHTITTSQTAISWTSTVYMTGAMWAVANPTRITIPTNGLYSISFAVQAGANGTGMEMEAFVKVNGTNELLFARGAGQYPSGGGWPRAASSFEFDLVAGDYLELMVRRFSGADTTIRLSDTFLQVRRVA